MSGSYPEHDKLLAAADRHEPVVEFFRWLEGRSGEADGSGFGRVVVCELAVNLRGEPQDFNPLSDLEKSKLIGEWLGVDHQALQDEKERMLRDLRAAVERKRREEVAWECT